MTNEPVRWLIGGSAEERQLLEMLGSERPTEELGARMRGVVLGPVLATLAAGTAATAGNSPPTNTTGVPVAKSLGLGAGAVALGALVSVGLLGLGGYLGGSTAHAPASAVASPGEHPPEAKGHEVIQQGSAERSVAPLAESVSAVDVPVEVGSPVKARADASATKDSSRATTVASDTSSLSRELAILERARRAVESSDRRAALELLATYRAQFPEGQLRSEAFVLEQRAQSAR